MSTKKLQILSSVVNTDTTLTQEGFSADAKAVGDALAQKLDAANLPEPSPEVAGKALIANGDGTGFEFGEAVGGGGVQSDWNVNDPEADGYIKNRPFYSYTETTVSEVLLASGVYTSEYNSNFGAFIAQIGIDSSDWIPGAWNFNVVFDGVKYEKLVAFYTDIAGWLMGNGSLLAPIFEANGYPVLDDTGEPFVIQFVNDDPITTALLATDLTQSTTHEVSVVQTGEVTKEVTVKLSKKYYDGVGATYELSGGTGEVFNDYSENKASHEYSHAEGKKTSAGGIGAHAEGHKTDAPGDYSHAEGNSSSAIGKASHAEGEATRARGYCSHAEGGATDANGNFSHTEGCGTYANGESQHVQGSFNVRDTEGKYAHIVGNGTETLSRSNAHTIDWNGLGWFAGGLKVGGTGQDDPEAKNIATEEYVDSKAVNVTGATPGQMILVKSVDEEGKPTEWEVADPVKSWDDLGTKTVIGMILEETTLEVIEDENAAAAPLAPLVLLNANEEYTVNWNGTEYICVSETYSEPDDNGEMVEVAKLLGNTSILGGAQTNDIPFCIACFNEIHPDMGVGGMVVPLDGSTTVTVSIKGMTTIVNKIPYKYVNNPDYSAADGEDGHILNRTHYNDPEKVILSKQYVEASEGAVPIAESVELIPGVEYCMELYADLESEEPGMTLIATAENFSDNELTGVCCNFVYTDGHGNENHFPLLSLSEGSAALAGVPTAILVEGFAGGTIRVIRPAKFKQLDPMFVPPAPIPFFDLVEMGLPTLKPLENDSTTYRSFGYFMKNEDDEICQALNSGLVQFKISVMKSTDAAEEYYLTATPIRKYDTVTDINYVATALNGIDLFTFDLNGNELMVTLYENAIVGTGERNSWDSKTGKNVAFKEYFVDGATVIADSGAEIFNNYINNKATGMYSHAEGDNTVASGTSSHAEGHYTTASGMYSHAEGDNTVASGTSSHAEGSHTVASEYGSHAEGNCTIAASHNQHVQGLFNIADTYKYLHIVGNGDSDTSRSNAHTLDWDGNAWFAGDVYVGSTSGTNKDDGSKKLATEDYVNIRVPAWTDSDEGKFLRIINGTPTWVSIPSTEGASF